MVGHVPEKSFQAYGKVLSKYLKDPKNLFVISTDFCHWGKRFKFTHREPKDSLIHESIENLDRQGMSLIESHDLTSFTTYLATLKNTICGRLPLQIFLATLIESGGSTNFETIFVKYAQSSQITDDMDDSSVSYASGCTFIKH